MKEYDLIVVGSGSALKTVIRIAHENPAMKIAVIDKNGPGGISLSKGCIPSKTLVYHADLVREIERAKLFDIDVELKKFNFDNMMNKAREVVRAHKDSCREALDQTENVDFFPCMAEFVDPYEVTLSYWRAQASKDRIGLPGDAFTNMV